MDCATMSCMHEPHMHACNACRMEGADPVCVAFQAAAPQALRLRMANAARCLNAVCCLHTVMLYCTYRHMRVMLLQHVANSLSNGGGGCHALSPRLAAHRRF